MSLTPPSNVSGKTNVPIFALLSAVILFMTTIAALAFVPLNDRSTPIFLTLVGLVVSSVPALISAAFSERASRDIRNGVMVAKVKEGTHSALAEAGVTDAVKAGQESTPAAIAALTLLVQQVQKTADSNTVTADSNTVTAAENKAAHDAN